MMSVPASEGGHSNNSKLGLSRLDASLFSSILEDTITELRILSECNNERRIQKAWTDIKLLLARKFGVEEPQIADELEGVDPNNLGCIEYKLAKLESDRKLATAVAVSSYQDLTINRAYEPLSKYVKSTFELDKHRVRLEEDEAKNRCLRRDLIKQMRQQRNHIKSVLYDTDATIDELRTQVEDALLYSECRSRYTDNWQRARNEQHVQAIKDLETGPSEKIEYFKQRTDHEQRVHSEVETLINIVINETLEKVEAWMSKYDKDMEGIDLKIQIKKNDYHDMYDKRLKLEATIEKHDAQMKEWIHFKEEREKLRQYREKMANSAIIVQAWWRGMLVRRQLGPFKVVKKKKGPEKK